MNIRHVMFFLLGFAPAFAFSQFVQHAHGKEAPKVEKKEDMPCAKNTDIEKIMNDKGYMLLLNMSLKDNTEGVIETMWIGGQNIAITASVKGADSSCLIANMENVIVNPQSIEAIWENYKKQTKQKDI